MTLGQIQNCGWIVALQCPQRWDGLDTTSDPAVRGCATCLKDVYLCNSEADLRRRVSEGKCVAVGWWTDDDDGFVGVLAIEDGSA